MATHTPGPWSVHADSWGIEIRAASGDPRTYLCIAERIGGRRVRREDQSWDDGEAQANARLIAAAPDLLAALQALKERGHTQATWMLAERALAKATGEA